MEKIMRIMGQWDEKRLGFPYKDILVYVVLFFFMPPACLRFLDGMKMVNSVLGLGRYLITAVALCEFCLSRRSRRENNHVFFWMVSIMSLLMIVTMKMNGTIYLTAALSCITVIGWGIFNAKLFFQDRERLLLYYERFLFVGLLLHFLSQLIFKGGMTLGSGGKIFFLGAKNNMTVYVILYLLAYLLQEKTMKRKNMWNYLFFAMVDIFVIVNKSATSILIVVCVQFFWILMANLSRWPIAVKGLRVTAIAAIGIIVLFSAMEIWCGSHMFISGMLAGLFHKNVTFSGRKAIWALAVSFIAQFPYWGQGLDVKYDPWGNGKYVYSAHNTFLDLGVKYGFFMMILYAILTVTVVLSVYKWKEEKKGIILLAINIALLAAFQMEALAGTYPAWMILLLSYLLVKERNIREKITGEKGSGLFKKNTTEAKPDTGQTDGENGAKACAES